MTEMMARKIGNSIGVIFPKELVDKERIVPNQKLDIRIIKKTDLSDIFGSLKIKESGQEFKDMVRRGWI